MGGARKIAARLPLLLLAALSSAEIIDRIAVVVGNQAITENELLREIRLTAFLNDEQVRITPETKRQAANRLIEQKLVRKELTWSRYPVPAVSEVGPPLREIVNTRFQGSEAEMRAALAKYGLTEQDLKDHLLWRLTFLKFIDFRFRPGILITDEEIETYYRETVLPLEKATHPGGRPPTLDELRGRIEQTLTGRRVDRELDAWLKQARARTVIQFRERAFE